MKVLMLDHDPRLAASWHCDKQLAEGVFAAAALLSYAWHTLDNAAYDQLADEPADDRETVWIELHITAPTTGRESPPVTRRALAPHESPSSWWLLYGQRILRHWVAHDCPAAAWVVQLGGNYEWLWRYGMALSDEHTHRFGRPAPLTKILWTLEAVPYMLRGSLDTWSEVPPDMPEHAKVRDGDFYDTVQSYRRYVARHLQHLHAWTLRGDPPWINEFEGDDLSP